MQLPDKRVLGRLDELLAAPSGARVGVLGLGVSGVACAQYLLRRGALVVAADQAPTLSEAAGAALGGVDGVELCLGGVSASTFDDVAGVVVSPGVDPRQEAVVAAGGRGVPVFGELELCGSLPVPVVAVTGTNGKSTVSALIGELLVSQDLSAFVGGNFGEPIAAFVDSGAQADVAVLELSSYQLETAWRFAPEVAVVLNVQPDHLERYDDLDAYAAVKGRVFAGQRAGQVAVLNCDDERVLALGGLGQGEKWGYSVSGAIGELCAGGCEIEARPPHGCGLVPSGCLSDLGSLSLQNPALLGSHNCQNGAAAILAVMGLVRSAGEDDVVVRDRWAQLSRAFSRFSGLRHRLQTVGSFRGVRFVNDSKATNDVSAAAAVAAIVGPVVLLVGGRSKGAGYDSLVAACRGHVRLVVAFGEAKDEVAEVFTACEEATGAGVSVRDDLRAAFVVAAQLALPGDTVLLSPACASFDSYASYRQRGDAFCSMVAGLSGTNEEFA